MVFLTPLTKYEKMFEILPKFLPPEKFEGWGSNVLRGGKKKLSPALAKPGLPKEAARGEATKPGQ